MEPLRGWEPPPWSLTPKADALHQALYLLLLGSLPCALAMAPCKEEEYPVGSECCPKCSPGRCSPGGTSPFPAWSLSSCRITWGQLKPRGRATDGGELSPPASFDSSSQDPRSCSAQGYGLGDPDGPFMVRSWGPEQALGPVMPTCTRRLPPPSRTCPFPHPPSWLTGYRVKEACGELTGTLCVPCDPGTYTAHLNGLSECLQCRVCDPALGLVTRQKCSRTENTVCVCDQGHFCISEDGDDCAECRPHTLCRPGQRVRARGTERQDRVCEDCPSGTFSPSGTLEECQPWTTCSGPFQTEAEPGTSSSDITCSSRGLYVFVGSLVLIGVLCGLIVLGIRMKNRRSPGGPTKARLFHQVPRAPPDITTVALEETASVSPVSLPCVTGRE